MRVLRARSLRCRWVWGAVLVSGALALGVLLLIAGVAAQQAEGAGSHPRSARLSLAGCDVWDPAWSPDGSRIAFGNVAVPSNAMGAGGLIKTVNPAGTDLQVLTSVPSPPAPASPDAPAVVFHNDAQPAWSPDGRQLAFSTHWQYDNGGRTWDTWSLNTHDTSTGLVRTVAEGDPSAADPTWSATGVLGYDLYDGPYLDPAGFVLGARTFSSSSDSTAWTSPSWSPDGRRVAFEADGTPLDDGAVRIYLMNRQGARRLLVAGAGPVWSPDGRWIAYRSEGVSIDLISPDGKRRRHLLTLGSNTALDYTGVWSPHGARIAIGTSVVTLATGKERKLPLHPLTEDGSVSQPSWSPDGRWLVYADATHGLQLVRPDGTGLRTINPCALSPTNSGS